MRPGLFGFAGLVIAVRIIENYNVKVVNQSAVHLLLPNAGNCPVVNWGNREPE